MEGVGARLGRTSARYGPATTFTGPVRKWRKEWVPVAAPAAANGGTASSTGTGTGTGSRGNNLLLFKWTPANGAIGGGDGDQATAAEPAPRRRRYVPVSVVEEQGQESAKSDDENKANDEDPSSEPSNGKTDINDTPMDESQASDEDARDSSKNGGTDLNLNLGLKDPDGDNDGDTGEHEENRFKRKSVTPDLEMRM
ncbi:hypothetical protein QOZ80_8BG0655600 [Eleusine coracana subsp. coracana]|nr:hypothetical protein QOZ80_8BG0655600 [Eleusine coracana subsp. coracana]